MYSPHANPVTKSPPQTSRFNNIPPHHAHPVSMKGSQVQGQMQPIPPMPVPHGANHSPMQGHVNSQQQLQALLQHQQS